MDRVLAGMTSKDFITFRQIVKSEDLRLGLLAHGLKITGPLESIQTTSVEAERANLSTKPQNKITKPRD